MGWPDTTNPRILQNIFDLAHDIQILANILSLMHDDQAIKIAFNSWCRCPVHNKNEGGAKNSMHMTGGAADARFFRMVAGARAQIKPRVVCHVAYMLTQYRITNFQGNGLYPGRSHLDIRKKNGLTWIKRGADYNYGVKF